MKDDPTSIEERLTAIREKLTLLTERDTEFKTFGSKEPWNGHEYQLNPRLSVEEASRFEDFAQVTLPAEYRLFLMELADGGAGPCYGLLHLFAASEEVRSRTREGESREDWIAALSTFPIARNQTDSYIQRIRQLPASQADASPHNPPVFSFFDWYEHWLDVSLHNLEVD